MTGKEDPGDLWSAYLNVGRAVGFAAAAFAAAGVASIGLLVLPAAILAFGVIGPMNSRPPMGRRWHIMVPPAATLV